MSESKKYFSKKRRYKIVEIITYFNTNLNPKTVIGEKSENVFVRTCSFLHIPCIDFRVLHDGMRCVEISVVTSKSFKNFEVWTEWHWKGLLPQTFNRNIYHTNNYLLKMDFACSVLFLSIYIWTNNFCNTFCVNPQQTYNYGV